MPKAVWVAIPVLTLSAALGACSSDLDTRYGPPGGLRNAELPTPTSTGTSGDDSGAPPGDGGGGGGEAGEGGDAGGDGQAAACTVSFANDIYPKMQPAGTWQCSAGACHGATTMPILDATSATNTYNALKAYVINGNPYVNPASTQLTGSAIDCNLRGTCGAQQMPLTTGGATHASTTDLMTVDTWVECGAPDN